MQKAIIIILLCIPLYVINSFCDKHVSAKYADSGNVYNTAKFLIGALCFIPVMIFECTPLFGLGAILCGVLCGIMYAISKTIILKGYECTSVAFMTFCHSAGMIIPCVAGYLFWNEDISPAAVIGIALTVFSAVLLKGGKSERKGLSRLGILIGLTVFAASGGVMICQKLMGIYFSSESVSAYNFYSFVVPALIIGISATKRNTTTTPIKVLPFAASSAISLCVISFVMTKLAGSIPSVIMFPLFNGIGIVLVCIGSVFVFKERLDRKKILGIVIGLAGLYLINAF